MRRHLFLVLALFLLSNAGWAFAAEHTVRQKDHQFSPQELKIKKGDKVIFINDDNRTHNVFSASDSNRFDLKAQRPGAVGEIVFANAGIVDVRCAIHPSMKLQITVE